MYSAAGPRFNCVSCVCHVTNILFQMDPLRNASARLTRLEPHDPELHRVCQQLLPLLDLPSPKLGPDFLKQVASKAQQDQHPVVLALFGKTVALHVMVPALFPFLAAAFSTDFGPALPHWWPTITKAENVLWLRTPVAAQSWLHFAADLGKTIEIVLCGTAAEIVLVMLQDVAAKEVATILLMQKSSDVPNGLLQDLILAQPALVTVASECFKVPGARTFLDFYGDMERLAYEKAHHLPFSVIFDVLDQGIQVDLDNFPVAPVCLLIALFRIEKWAQGSGSALYANFNQELRKSLLLACLSDLGFVAAAHLLREQGMKVSDLGPLKRIFRHKSLPPVCKPHNLLAKPRCFLGTAAAFAENEMHETFVSVLLFVFRIISHIVEGEVKSASAVGKPQGLQGRMVAHIVEQLTGLVGVGLAALDGWEFEVLVTCARDVVAQIAAAGVDAGNVWVPIFDLALDLCYADLRFVPVFACLFERLVATEVHRNNETLVRSGLTVFFSAFDAGVPHDAVSRFTSLEPAQGSVSVPLEEFRHLYVK